MSGVDIAIGFVVGQPVDQPTLSQDVRGVMGELRTTELSSLRWSGVRA